MPSTIDILKILGWVVLAIMFFVLVFTEPVTKWLGFVSVPVGLLSVLAPLVLLAVGIEVLSRRLAEKDDET